MRTKRTKATFASLAGLSCLATAAIALPAFAAEAVNPWSHLLQGVVGTVIFGLLGIVLALLGMKAFEWSTPYSVRKELEEDHNTAVAIVMGSMTLGICLIIAATILS